MESSHDIWDDYAGCNPRYVLVKVKCNSKGPNDPAQFIKVLHIFHNKLKKNVSQVCFTFLEVFFELN